MGSNDTRVEIELAPNARAPGRARNAVDGVTAAMAGDVGFRARLAASELVANSVAHAAASSADGIRLTVARIGAVLRVEVRDGGAPFDSEVRIVSERATSGRGLRLVDALVDRWGSDHANENVVWFEIDRPADDDRAPTTPPSRVCALRVVPDLQSPGDPDVALAAAVLARAAERVREGWCQDVDAADSSGRPVEPWAEEASAWSLLGAVVAALDGPAAVAGGAVPLTALATAMAAHAELVEDRSLGGWNDAPTRTQHDVVAALERARLQLRGGRVRA